MTLWFIWCYATQHAFKRDGLNRYIRSNLSPKRKTSKIKLGHILAINFYYFGKYVNLIVFLWLRFPLYCSFKASRWLNVLNSDSHRKIIAFKGLLNLLEIKLCNVTSSSTSSSRFILKWNIEGEFYDEFSEWCVLSKYLCLIIIDILFAFFQFLAWSSDCIFSWFFIRIFRECC